MKTSHIAILFLLLLAVGGAFYWESLVSQFAQGRRPVSELRAVAAAEIAGLIREDLDALSAKAKALEASAQRLLKSDEGSRGKDHKKTLTAWREALLAWKASEWTCFGRPAELFYGRQLAGAADLARIRALLARAENARPNDGVWLEGEGNEVRGLRAIGWQLSLEHSSLSARQLLASQCVDFGRRVESYRSLWLDGGLDSFENPKSSKNGVWGWANHKEALDGFVNRLIALVLRYRDRDLAPLVGATAGGVEQEWNPDRNLHAALKDELRVSYGALRGLYSLRSPGFSKLVAAQSPRIDEAIRRRLDLAVQKMIALPEDLDAAVAAQDPRLQEAYTAATSLKISYGADLPAALDTTLSLSLNDGD